MARKVTLHIPEPCHEDWNQMTPKQKGRHCAVCEKVVVDFSNKSDAFIAKYIRKNDNVCGRLKASQLNRPIDLSLGKRALLPPLAASFIFPLAMLTATSAYGQGEVKSFNSNTDYQSLNIGNKQLGKQRGIKGVIKDASGTPLAGVRIRVVETNDQIQTDNKGTYRLRVRSGQTLQFTYIGFLSVEHKVNEVQDVYDFVLEQDPQFETDAKVLMCSGIRVTEELTTPMIIQNGLVVEEFEEMGEVLEVKVENDSTKQDSLGPRLVRGNITDDTGLPLPGVNVVVRGTTNGTMTDFDGNYELEIEPGQTTVFSYIGFETQEIPIQESTERLDVQMIYNEEFYEVMIVGLIATRDTSPTYSSEYRNAYNPSLNFNGNPETEARKEAYANTIEFKRIQQEKRKAERQERKKRK